MDKEECNQLYRVNKTLLKMLQDRGFVIPEKYNAMDEAQFEQKLGVPLSRQNLTLLFGLGANPEERIFVFFSGEKKLKVDHITSFGRRMHDENVLKAIIVIKGEITTLARQAMQEISQRFQVESFEEKDLLVNITEHELVPKHIKLTPEEKQALLDRYRVKDSQLPKILLNDPVAKYYGLRKGEVVKIIRTSETAGKYITYRLVV